MVLAQINAVPLKQEQIDNLVSALRQEILKRVQPKELILFGSAARSEMTAYSDLDIVVVVDSPEDIRTTARSLNGLSGFLQWPVDVLVVDKKQFEAKRERGGVFWDAGKYGKHLFERGDE